MLLSQPMDEIGCLFARHAFSPFGISAQGQVEPALRRVATEIEHCENIDNHRAQSLLSLDRTYELPDNPRYHLVLVFVEIGRAHVCTPLTNAHHVCCLLP